MQLVDIPTICEFHNFFETCLFVYLIYHYYYYYYYFIIIFIIIITIINCSPKTNFDILANIFFCFRGFFISKRASPT